MFFVSDIFTTSNLLSNYLHMFYSDSEKKVEQSWGHAESAEAEA
jgi:hypothetical protein